MNFSENFNEYLDGDAENNDLSLCTTVSYSLPEVCVTHCENGAKSYWQMMVFFLTIH